MWKDYVDIFSALLTPLIAIITTYIAVQQYRRERAKFRHELYDRRMAVYKAASNYLSVVIRSSSRDNPEEEEKAYKEFVMANAESQFLFDKDVQKFLAELQAGGSLRAGYRREMKRADPDEEIEQIKHLNWVASRYHDFARQQGEVFMKYLNVKNLK
jgi:hypothetical protein